MRGVYQDRVMWNMSLLTPLCTWKIYEEKNLGLILQTCKLAFCLNGNEVLFWRAGLLEEGPHLIGQRTGQGYDVIPLVVCQVAVCLQKF